MPPSRKYTYSNKYKENFKIKNSDTFHISAQNIDCGYSLTSTHTSMFLSRNKENNVYPIFII